MQVTFARATDVEEFLLAALPESEKWKSVDIQVTPTKVVPFWIRDIIACIVRLYGSVKHGTNFAYKSDTSAKNKPHGTTVWLREEGDVQRRLGVHAVIAGVQLYADATVVYLKGRYVHPVYICLENHPYEEKIKCIETIAYLPEIGPMHGTNNTSDQLRILKLELYHASFRILLAPLKSLLLKGLRIEGPDKLYRLVVPVLLNFIGDNPEVCACLVQTTC